MVYKDETRPTFRNSTTCISKKLSKTAARCVKDEEN